MGIKEVEQRISHYLILFEGKALTRKQTIAKIIHIQLPGKVCPKCTGDGQRRIPVEGMGVAIEEGGCPKCHGTGKLPPVTIEDVINATCQ